MDRLQNYLDIVPLPVLALIAMIGAVVFLVIPSRVRLLAALMILPVWLSIGRFPELGSLATICKATSVIAYGLVFVAATIDPGPKRRLPMVVWLYPVLGFMTIFFVMTTVDRTFAVVLRVQLTVMMLAAVMTARTLVDERAVMRSLTALAIGSGGSIMIALGYLLLHPGGAFASGLGRFEPWGANQNQIGTIFLLGAPLLIYTAARSRNVLYQAAAFGSGALGVLLGFLTASRSVVFPLLGILAIIGWEFRKKPLVAAMGAVMALAAVGVVGSKFAEVDVGRLGSVESERFTIWADYWQTIQGRPLAGLAFTQGESTETDTAIGAHAHNAYLQNGYWYGLALSIPFLFLAGYTCFAATMMWLRRSRIAADPSLITLLWVLTGTVYLHGMTTIVIYYPTYTWALFHVLLSALVISMYKSPGAELGAVDWHDEADDGFGGYDEYHSYDRANDDGVEVA